MTIVQHGKTSVESSKGMRIDLDYLKYLLGQRHRMYGRWFHVIYCLRLITFIEIFKVV